MSAGIFVFIVLCLLIIYFDNNGPMDGFTG